MIKIYFDNCCYNRQFDDFSVVKNGLEANAKLLLNPIDFVEMWGEINDK